MRLSMNCPRCESSMKELNNRNVVVDVCSTGCGGIWFDWQELRKMDESHEADPQFLAQLPKNLTKKIDSKQRLHCPDCKDIIMMRRFESIKKQVEVDECPKCGGMWLDSGELLVIQTQFKNETEKRAATDKMINDMFANELDKLKTKSTEENASVDKVKRTLSSFLSKEE